MNCRKRQGKGKIEHVTGCNSPFSTQRPLCHLNKVSMKTGFLTLITHPDHQGLVRVIIRDRLPEIKKQDDGSEIRYVARFEDIDAGMMHVQNIMHSALVDLENRIYRGSLPQIIATVEADYLDHSRIWMDPVLSEENLEEIDALIKQQKASQRRTNRIWQIVGWLGLLLLVLTSLRL